jgi:hypothetical protein
MNPMAFSAPSSDELLDEHDLMVEAIMEYLGLEWCSACGQLEPANQHVGANSGTNMGFPQPEPEQGYF